MYIHKYTNVCSIPTKYVHFLPGVPQFLSRSTMVDLVSFCGIPCNADDSIWMSRWFAESNGLPRPFRMIVEIELLTLVCCLLWCRRQIDLLRTVLAPSLSLFTLLSFTDCSSLSLLRFASNGVTVSLQLPPINSAGRERRKGLCVIFPLFVSLIFNFPLKATPFCLQKHHLVEALFR